MRNCKRCQHEFEPVRTAQLYCSRKCRVADAVSRHRSEAITGPQRRSYPPQRRLYDGLALKR